MKKIRLLFLTLVALLGTVTASASKTVYIQPNDWTNDDAVISLWIWGDGVDGSWATLSTVEEGILKATFDDAITGMIVARGSVGNTLEESAGMYNKTADLAVESGKLYSITGWSGAAVGNGITLSDYTEPVAAGYTVDFNTAIAVPSNNHSDPMFQVATGWTRIADRKEGDNYYGTAGYYMRYTYSSTAGVDGTGTLLANAQQAPQSSYDGSIETVHDYIVTPIVSGKVTLQVKGSTSASNSLPSFINFYAVDDDATTVGDEITASYSAELNTDEFVTVTLNLATATRIAIRAQWVYMDNFTATSAEIPDVTALTVTSVMSTEGQSGTTGTNPAFEQQEDGTLLVKLKVSIQNTGNVDLVAGTTENYTLTLASASSESGTKTYYEATPITITEDLAVGASTTIDVEVAVNYTDTYASYRYWFVRENVSGTTSSSYRYASVTAYESKFVLREAGTGSTTDLTGTVNYGKISEATTKSFEIYNDGTGPLTIKSITLPAGFTCDNLPEIPAEGLVVAKKEATAAFDITLPMDVAGAISGDLVIVYNDAAGLEKTKSVTLSGNVLTAGMWFADFDVASSSETNYPAGSVAENGIRFGTTYVTSGVYDGYLYSYTSSSYASANNKFITPKLHAAAGDKLTFDVRRDDSSSSTYNLKVYVSTDRTTWGNPVYSVTAADLTSTFQTKEITFDAEGDYYVAFAIYGVRVDNLIGLTKVDVAHDLYIKSVSWPDASVKSGTALSKPSVDIIPLTTEAADAYTVKYVCGETVLAEATSIALTASANSSKTIAFSWTPEVETTTTFPGTKVVFEFTDGTKYETETFDLTVTNESKFHFVKTLPSSKWYEPSDYTTPITFGKTNTADAQTFYVYNWGSATLNVKSITVPEGFTVTPAEAFTVAPFDENDMSVAAQAVEITFSATEAGEYSGEMVITYVNAAGEDATFPIAVSGVKLDPTKFYANFDNASENVCNWPAGSVYQANIKEATGNYSAPYNYYIYSTSSTDNLFVTPKLVSTGENLLFDAKLYSTSWPEGKVVVYAAATREEVLNAEEGTTRQQLFSVSGQDAENAMTTAYQTFTVQVPAGEWYLGFEISGRPYVDELYGLKLAEVEHDWTIVSSNVPAEAMQNVASTATVNILNLGLKDEAAEDITVTVYVDGEAVTTGEGVAIPMNHKLTDAGTQLSVNYISNKAGILPVYLEVKAGEYSVATDPVNVTFAEEEAKSDATADADGTSTTVPLNLSYYNSESVSLYTANVLEGSYGLSSGAKIKSITYKGYKTADTHSSTLNVWYEWVDATAQSQPASGLYDTSNMTQIVTDQTTTWEKKGSASELEDFITLNFSEPLVYQGKALRIVVRSTSDAWKGAYFEKSTSSTSGLAYYHYNDTYSTFTSNSWTSSVLPVLHLELDASAATLSGTVKTSAGAGIGGATVTLKAENGVQYAAKADESGDYTMNVIQAGLDFTATVEAEGFLKREFALNMGGESKTNDVTMYRQFGIVGSLPGLDWNNDLVMTQSAEDPNIFTAELTGVNVSEAGTYKYKLRADGAWATDLAEGYELPVSGDEEWQIKTAGTYNYKFTFDWTNHTLTFERPFTLAEDAKGVMALNWVDVTIEREFKAGWNAVVLPFKLSVEEVKASFGENAEVAYFAGDEKDANGAVTVKFGKRTEGDIEAGVPYLVWSENTVSGLKFTKDIVTDQWNPTTGTTYDFVGVYEQTTTADGDYIVQGGEFRKASASNFVKPFRAYLQLKEGADPARSLSFVIGDQTVTEIAGLEVEGQTNVEGVYNLQGQKVTKMNRKGLYIINGKKVMMK